MASFLHKTKYIIGILLCTFVATTAQLHFTNAQSFSGVISGSSCAVPTGANSCAVTWNASATLLNGWIGEIWTAAGSSNEDASGVYSFSTTLTAGQCMDGTFITHSPDWTGRTDYGPKNLCAVSSASATPTPTPNPSGISCSLSTDKSSINAGDTITWTVSSNPPGYTGCWYGTKNGVSDANCVPVRLNTNFSTPPFEYSCDTGGTYTRYVVLKDASGNPVCTTNTVSVSVNNQVPLCGVGTGPVSCLLDVSQTDICVGDNVTWTVGASIGGLNTAWYGTKTVNGQTTTDASGVPAGTSNDALVYGPYDCSTLGAYTRYAVVSQNGSSACTTASQTVTVRDCTGACGANAITAPLPLAPQTCSSAAGFSSSCVNTSPVALMSTPNTQAGNLTDFTVYVKPPENGLTNAIWNQGYYWSEVNKRWVSFTLFGDAYPGVPCTDAAKGCWLTNKASTHITVSAADATGGTIYAVSWYYTYQNGAWQGPACTNAAGSCWIVQAALDTQAIVAKIEKTSSLDEAVAIAKAAGLAIKENFGPGVRIVHITHPLTGQFIASISQMQQASVSEPQSISAACLVADSKLASASDYVNVFTRPDGKIDGVTRDYKFSTPCYSGDSPEFCSFVNTAANLARGEYDKVSGGPHSSSSGQDSIVVYPINLNSKFGIEGVLGVALKISVNDGSGGVRTVCMIGINDQELFSSVGLANTIEHEMGHCFGFFHNDQPGYPDTALPNDPIMNAVANPEASVLNPISSRMTKALVDIKNGASLYALFCKRLCTSDEEFSAQLGECMAKAPSGGGGAGTQTGTVTPTQQPAATQTGCTDMHLDNEGHYICGWKNGTTCDCSRSTPDCVDADGYEINIPPDACLFGGGGGSSPFPNGGWNNVWNPWGGIGWGWGSAGNLWEPGWGG